MSKKLSSIITGTLATIGAVTVVAAFLYKKGYLEIEIKKDEDEEDPELEETTTAEDEEFEEDAEPEEDE